MFWEYDGRIGRRWNLDPKSTIGVSDYSCLGNSPIWHNDPLGDKIKGKTNEDATKAQDKIKESLGNGKVGQDFIDLFTTISDDNTIDILGDRKTVRNRLNHFINKTGEFRGKGDKIDAKKAAMMRGFLLMMLNTTHTVEIEFDDNFEVDRSTSPINDKSPLVLNVKIGLNPNGIQNTWKGVDNKDYKFNSTQAFVHEILGEAFAFTCFKNMNDLLEKRKAFNSSGEWSNDPYIRQAVLHIIQAENLFNTVNRTGTLGDHVPWLNIEDLPKVGNIPDYFDSSSDKQPSY